MRVQDSIADFIQRLDPKKSPDDAAIDLIEHLRRDGFCVGVPSEDFNDEDDYE